MEHQLSEYFNKNYSVNSLQLFHVEFNDIQCQQYSMIFNVQKIECMFLIRTSINELRLILTFSSRDWSYYYLDINDKKVKSIKFVFHRMCYGLKRSKIL